MLYFGENSVSIDEKARFMIPLATRQIMETHDHEVWYLTPGFDGAVFLFDSQKWQSIIAMMGQPSPLDPRMLDFRRFLVGSAAKVKRDNQGRMVIPQHLREYAGIQNDAVLIGVDDHLELWSKEGWRGFQQRQMQGYKAMAGELFGARPGSSPQEAGGNGNAAN